MLIDYLPTLQLIKPYWSKQHGAYLTLITCWFIAVALSHRTFSTLPFQVSVMLLLLAGLNFGELLIEKLTRKTSLPHHKQIWLFIYFLITTTTGIVVYAYNDLPFLLPILVIGGLFLVVLSFKRLQKSIAAELITFALFSFAGLLAYRPDTTPDFKFITTTGLLMSLYFGISVFTVKVRFGKALHFTPFIYAICASCLALMLNGISMLAISLSLLLFLKAFPPFVINSWYSKLKIKHIGMLEMAFHLAFVFMLYILYK